MKPILFAVLDIETLRWEEEIRGEEYSGPIEFCDRGQSTAVTHQGIDQSKQDQANAQGALGAVNQYIGGYNRNLSNFIRFGRQAYGAGGEFARDQNTIANTVAKAGSDKIGGDLALNAMRTGENTGNYAANLAESSRAASRDLTDQLAKADADRLGKLTGIEQYGVEASKLQPEVYASLYGPSVSGASSNLGVASHSAASNPSFGDVFGEAFGADLAKMLTTPAPSNG